MEKLKVCPFCGGQAKVMDMGYPHWVYCTSCGAKVQGRTTDEKDSIKAWNKRVLQTQDVPDKNAGDTVSKRDAQEHQRVAQKRRYTFANDEFSLESAYRDCKLIFDGITDDDSFQEADAGLVFYYANEIIYALREALQSKDTNVGDTISRQAAIDCFWTKDRHFRDALDVIKDIRQLPSAQPEVVKCKDCKYFELDHFEKVENFPIPIIVAHEACMKWGNGCQSSADGWCFMAERRTDERPRNDREDH